MKSISFEKKIDGKRHIVREIRCRWLGWHSPSAFSETAVWCWYCGEDMGGCGWK